MQAKLIIGGGPVSKEKKRIYFQSLKITNSKEIQVNIPHRTTKVSSAGG